MSDSAKSEGKRAGGIGVAVGLVGIVMMLILPIPPVLLDVLLAVSITISLLIFLMAVNFDNPLEFSTFPSVLLVATMLRLGLNVASTRLILLHGHEGPDAAGSVIEAFGAFVVGGSYVVGVIVFVILVVINFKVITAGASRIAEVAARFTLDAMPGKQMAIDSDLAGGHITEQEARKRRQAVFDEADFYGAMDGANKFVKGDAVAGLVVTIVNVVGGIVIAVGQRDMSIADAAETYTLLTVGDGLVSQIPALLVSIAAGIIASRTSTGTDLGSTLVWQFLRRPTPLYIGGGSLIALALVPGMPTLSFLGLGVLCIVFGRRATTRQDEAPPGEETPESKEKDDEPPLADLLHVDLLALEVGFDLVPLVDRNRGGELIQRIAGIRKQLCPELGVVVPPVHIRDNLQLASSKYRLLLSGTSIGEGLVRMGRLMAIRVSTSGPKVDLKGERCEDPAFGMPAVWIPSGDRERAELLGFTVVDPATVITTHLTELLKSHSADLLGRTEAQELLDAFAFTHSKLVEEVIPNLLPLGEVIKILKNLLREGVSIRDLRTILEAVADHATTVKNTDALTEYVRTTLARQLTAHYVDAEGNLAALLLAPDVELALRGRSVGGGPTAAAGAGAASRMGGDAGAATAGHDPNGGLGGRGPDPTLVPRVIGGLEQAIAGLGAAAVEPLVITAPDIRRTVALLAARHAPGLAVLSFNEVDPKVTVNTVGIVKLAA